MESSASDSNTQVPANLGIGRLAEYESIMSAVGVMLPKPNLENYMRVFDRLKTSQFYDPKSSALDRMSALLTKGDNTGVIDCYRDANPNYVITPEAQMIYGLALKNTGNLSVARIFANAADSVCKAIITTGDGTIQRPYVLLHSHGINGFVALALDKEPLSSRSIQAAGRLLVAVKCKDGAEIFCDVTATTQRPAPGVSLPEPVGKPASASDSKSQTLYESWQARRKRLDSATRFVGDHTASQIHVLDYLLNRYAGDPLGQAAAVFPARTEVMLNRRTVVVHDHIGRGVVAGIKTEQEASGRAASILKRIASVDPQASVKAPGHGIFREEDPDSKPQPQNAEKGGIAGPQQPAAAEPSFAQRRAWGKINTAIKYGATSLEIFDLIKGSYAFSPVLPERAVAYLFERVDNAKLVNVLPAELLSHCNNTSALEYALLAWRNRLAALGAEPVGDRLKHACMEEGRRERALKLLRTYLADVNGAVRMEAVRLLGQLGTLDDVGLLLDLISLPPLSDELPGERGLLMEAAARLAGAMLPESPPESEQNA